MVFLRSKTCWRGSKEVNIDMSAKTEPRIIWAIQALELSGAAAAGPQARAATKNLFLFFKSAAIYLSATDHQDPWIALKPSLAIGIH